MMKTKLIKTKHWTLLLILAITTIACSKDDGPGNLAPEKASLLTPTNQAKDIEINDIELRWKASNDPNDDLVTYDIYLDTVNPPVTVLKSGVYDVTLGLQEELKYGTTYYWSVVAKDDSGAESDSEVAAFTTREQRVDELLIGKWMVEKGISESGTVVEDDCIRRSSFEFKTDGILRYTAYSGDPCEMSGDLLYNYEVTTSNNIVLSSTSDPSLSTIVRIITLSETQLEIKLDSGVHFILAPEL